METERMGRILHMLLIGIALVFLTATASLATLDPSIAVIRGTTAAEIKAEIAAEIEAEVAAAVATATAAGEDTVLASKVAVVNAIRAIVAANPDYSGGLSALNTIILDTLKTMPIAGMSITDLLICANHALGITEDPELAAYERTLLPIVRKIALEGLTPSNKNENTLGPDSKPQNASPI